MSTLIESSTQVETRELTVAAALNEALREEMSRDDRVFLLGEDVGAAGGVYKVTDGLYEEFGAGRVIDSPISEAGIVGLAVGAAMTGRRPVVEVMFGDFLFLAMDQIVNQAAKIRYMSGGAWHAPMVIRTTLGAGRRAAAQHSQSVHAMVAHIPGLKVVLPSDAADAKGMLKAAIRDDDPVVFFEDKLSYREIGPVPRGEYLVPLGQALVRRHGRDVTLVATSSMVGVAMSAAETLAGASVEAEVVDVRCLSPLDLDTVLDSVRRTGRCVVVDEGHRRFGATAELAASVAENAYRELVAPVRRLAAMDVPVPFSPVLEDLTIPRADQVVTAVNGLMAWER
ncbi:alpha-ketoacid dehydrogenase subunit beta [Tenggerimyces flavus]|uniref:Alpha-ketoacid dehydrogenase subunit beta n=1 Tax=Tenggerimyces flavus TaxID=1708749 RepID=A0ABV7YJX6_9ACTN|nr:alpha-ketoacid dehydrogenase subunit beta [Tenggerimyces flavus]MBM7789627.1 pyruvate dehydrogenase E1 component beta subunit [Tenggerimyces flavus]